MRSFRFALRDTLRLIRRSPGVSGLTFLTVLVVFFFVGSSFLLALNTRHVISVVEGELVIQAYIQPKGNLDAVKKKALALPHVKGVRAISSEEALELLKARLGNQSAAVTLLGENPLPASVEVRVDKASSVSGVARELVSMPDVEDVVYAGKVAEKLARLSRFAEVFSLFLLVFAGLAGALVLYNTIRVAIYSRKQEIEVMLLVGAMPGFVALPFVLLGVFWGFTGTLAASLVLGILYKSFVTSVQHTLPFIQLLDTPDLFLKLAVVLVGGGIALSWLCSWLAVERHIAEAMKPS
ncbi:MAG: cell division protein FtsX [Synergistales bacterium]|jgi:cell division transport system permease protein